MWFQVHILSQIPCVFLNDKIQLQVNLIRKQCNGLIKASCYISKDIGLLCLRLQFDPEVTGIFSRLVQ